MGNFMKKLVKKTMILFNKAIISSFFCLIFLLAVGELNAQNSDTVSFEVLFAEALENNYGLLITKNTVEILKLNNTYGNAGFLPTMGAGIISNNSVLDGKTVNSDGTEMEYSGKKNSSIDAYVLMNWTLFDGTKMFVTKDRLNEMEKMGTIGLQLEIEAVYVQLASLYYALMQEQKLAQVLQYTMGISKFRFELADKKYRLGAASEIDRIQASIDLSNDSSLFIKQETRIANLKADINHWLGRSPDIQFAVPMEMDRFPELNYSDLESQMEKENRILLLAKNRVQIKKLELDQTTSSFLPTLDLFADYDYYHSRYSSGQIDWTQNVGPTAGLKLSYSLFNGFNDSRKRQIAKVEYQTAQLEEESEWNTIKLQWYQTYNTYISAMKQIKLETENMGNARKNLHFAIELYQRGAINEIDFREIQRKEFDAESKLLYSQYYAKIAEIQLLQLSGSLKF